jgi:CheY-like chemotaxis protein
MQTRCVLIVEDNFDQAQTLCAFLGMKGHRLQVAPSGPLALEMARRLRPDVVLLDLGLPGIDGFEVARRVRAQGGRHPVLIALTGYGQPEDRQRASEAGFDHLLVKPVDPTVLAALLATLEIPGRGSRG